MSVNVNVTQWEPAQRRTSSLVVLGIAIAAIAGALSMWLLLDDAPGWIYWALVGLLVLVLAFQAVLLFAKPTQRAAPAVAEAAPEPAPAVEAAAPAPQALTLRCGDCGTVFDVTDTGERPLYHACPGCGAEGALRAPEAEAAPSPYAPPYAPPQPEPAPPAAPVAAAAPAAGVRKLKLRCGGCKEVFSIEDTGERPLKRGCPHCGRMGVIH